MTNDLPQPTDARLTDVEVDAIYDALPKLFEAETCYAPLGRPEEPYYSRSAIRLIGNAVLAIRTPDTPSEDVGLFALNLKSVAKRERNVGNSELSELLDEAALTIDRLTALSPPRDDSLSRLTDDQLAQCIGDPGAIVGLKGENENVPRWAVRAIRALLSQHKDISNAG